MQTKHKKTKGYARTEIFYSRMVNECWKSRCTSPGTARHTYRNFMPPLPGNGADADDGQNTRFSEKIYLLAQRRYTYFADEVYLLWKISSTVQVKEASLAACPFCPFFKNSSFVSSNRLYFRKYLYPTFFNNDNKKKMSSVVPVVVKTQNDNQDNFDNALEY